MNVSGLSAIVDFIKLILLLCSGCGYVWMRAKTFSRSPLGYLAGRQKTKKCPVLPADFSTGHGEDGGSTLGEIGFPFHPRRTHTPTHTTHILFRNKIPFFRKSFLFSVHYMPPELNRIRLVAGRLGKGCVQHTRLCRLMVYSRDTTSAIAERLLPVLTLDISVEKRLEGDFRVVIE